MIWPRRKSKPVSKITRDEIHITWADVFKRVAFAETQIFPTANRAALHGIDPVGSVFAALIAAQSDRLDFAETPNDASALVIGFSGPHVIEWGELFPDKTVVAMFDKTDSQFVGKWIVLPWEIHHSIQSFQ